MSSSCPKDLKIEFNKIMLKVSLLKSRTASSTVALLRRLTLKRRRDITRHRLKWKHLASLEDTRRPIVDAGLSFLCIPVPLKGVVHGPHRSQHRLSHHLLLCDGCRNLSGKL